MSGLIFGGLVLATVCLSVGVTWGVQIAEKSAVIHSDCSTAHHMRGGFYYIVPEKEYCRLVMLQYGEDGKRIPEDAQSV